MQYLAHIRKHDTRKSIQILEEKKHCHVWGKGGMRDDFIIFYFDLFLKCQNRKVSLI